MDSKLDKKRTYSQIPHKVSVFHYQDSSLADWVGRAGELSPQHRKWPSGHKTIHGQIDYE